MEVISMLKRMLALFLSIVMLLGAVPVSVFAAEMETVPAEAVAETILETTMETTEPDVTGTAAPETAYTVSQTEEAVAAEETTVTEEAETESAETEPEETEAAQTEPLEETEPVQTEAREERIPQPAVTPHREYRPKTFTKTEDVLNVIHVDEQGHIYFEDETVVTEDTRVVEVKQENLSSSSAIREEEWGDIYFDTFEDLKELAGRSYSENTYAYYEGEGPLVISEDLTLPYYLDVGFYTDNSHLIINEGVTFETGSYNGIYVDVLEINGIFKNRAWTDVEQELIINGTLSLYESMTISQEAVLRKNGQIIYNDEWCYLERNWNAVTEEDVRTAVDAANADNSGVRHGINLTMEGNITLSRDLTIPGNASFHIDCAWIYDEDWNGTRGDYTFTVPRGVTLTLNSDYYSSMSADVVISGVFENNSEFNINEYYGSVLTFASTGVYKGKGAIEISTDDPEADWTDFVVGLNMTGIEVEYNQYDSGWRYWELYDVTGLTKLGTPTNLTWHKTEEWVWNGNGYTIKLKDKKGSVAWKPVEPDQAEARVTFCLEDGTQKYNALWGFGSMELPEWRSVDSFILDDPESGTYYFTVQSTADRTGYRNSDIAKSSLWTYTKPTKALGTVSNLRWEYPACKWDHAAGLKDGSSYEIEWLYAPTLEEEPWVINGSWGSYWKEWGWEPWQGIYQDHGTGYYYFRVRPLSDDITKICNGQWSELSEPFYMNELVQNAKDQLDNISTKLPDEAIRDEVQALDTEELKAAMLADNGTEGIMDTLEKLEDAVGGAAGIQVSEEVSNFDADKISIVGANLNNAAEESSEPITLVLDKPQEEHVLDAQYDNSVAVSFSMTLDNVEDAENLAVPVKVTLPVPENINPDFLVILHYKQNGEVEEISMPWLHIFRVDNQVYTSFVLTSFSDFAMTHYAELEEDGGSEKDLQWSLSSWGKLVISGEGDMEDYEYPEQAPWFASRDLIRSVTLEDGVYTVGANAFCGYEKLEEVSLPGDIGRVDPTAFMCCYKLKDITLREGEGEYSSRDGVVFTMDESVLVVYPAGKTENSYAVPESVEIIGEYAFYGNRKLQQVTLPDSLQTIESWAFAETVGLEALELPANLGYIYDYAFSNSFISELWFAGNVPDIGNDGFAGMSATAYYPANDETWTEDYMLSYGGDVTWCKSSYIEVSGGSSVVAGGSVKLTGRILPDNEAGRSISWKLAEGDSRFATLKVSGSTATITAADVSELRTVTVIAYSTEEVASCKFALTIQPKTKLLRIGERLSDEELDLEPVGVIVLDEEKESGFRIQLGVQAEPVGANAAVTWSSSNAKVATIGVADGTAYFTGAPGVVKFTATAADGSRVKAEITYTVVEKLVAGTVGDTSISLVGGKGVSLKVVNTLTGKEFKSKDLRWTIYAEDAEADAYASINASGKLTTKKVLKETKLYVYGDVYSGETLLDGVMYEVTVYPAASHVKLAVDGEVTEAKTIRFDREEQSKLKLTANVFPADAQPVDVTWSVSDKKEVYASYEVDGNELIIRDYGQVKDGTVTIKATTNDGSRKTATLKVEVGIFADRVDIGKMGVDDPLPMDEPIVLRTGEKLDLWAKVYANGKIEASGQEYLTSAVSKPGVVWSLANPADKAYLTVSGKGSLKAGKVYTESRDVTVLATSKDGEAVGKVVVTVVPSDDTLLNIWTLAENTYGVDNVTKSTYIVDLNGEDRSVTLQATGLDGLPVEEVQWNPIKSSKKAEVTVNENGTLTVNMLAAGSLKVTAKSGKRSTDVTLVAAYQAKDIIISQKKTNATENLMVASGKSLDLQAAMGNATNKKVTWSVAEEDAAYAKIAASGKLTATKDLTQQRTVTVIATAQDGSSAQGTIEVTIAPLAQGVQMYSQDDRDAVFFSINSEERVRSNTTFEWDMARLDEEGKAKDLISLSAFVYPYYGDDDGFNAIQDIQWQTSSKAVADFVYGEDGSVQLKCLKPGNVTITAKALDGSNAKVSVKIKIVARIRKLSLKEDAPINENGALEVLGGKGLDLSKVIEMDPLVPTNKKLNWKVVGGDGAAFATVNASGKLSTKKVTGAKTVCVKAMATDGSEAWVQVNVTILPG